MERKHTNLTRRGPAALGLALLATLATGCGGGGGGGGGAGSVNPLALGAITASHLLADVDPASAATTARTGPGPAGYRRPRALALDSARDRLYFVEDSTLLYVHASGGPAGLASDPVPVGTLPYPTPTCMTWDPVGQQLYGIATFGGVFPRGELLRIDPATGESELVADCAPTTHVAYDPPSGMLFGTYSGKFQRIHPQTGATVELFQDVAYVASSSGLVSDPATGLFYAAWNPIGGTPGILSISLSGQLQVIDDCERPLAELAVDADTGRFLGLTRGAALVELSGFAPNLTWNELGMLGCSRVISMSFDPADGAYFGVNLDTDLAKSLVKLDPDGRPRALAGLDADVGWIAYDPVRRELWGIELDNGDLLSIDVATGATHPVGNLSFSPTTRLAVHPTTGELYGYSPGAQVTVRIDPHTPDWSIAGNAVGVSNVTGITYDPVQDRLVAAWTPTLGSSQVNLSAWNPFASGVAQGLVGPPFYVSALGRDAHRGRMFAYTYSNHGAELFQFDASPSGRPQSFRSLWNLPYRAATRIPGLGRGFAVDDDSVYGFDLVTGETERVGSTASTSGTTGVTWDPQRDLLGFVSGNTIRWSRTNTPWLAQDVTTLGVALDVLAHDETRDLFFGVGGGTVYSVALNANGAITLPLGPVPAGLVVRDVACKNGALYAAGNDLRLYRIDVDTGAWTDVGRTAFELIGLY